MSNDNNNPNTMFGIDPDSQEFASIISASAEYLGGRENMVALVEGAMPGSRTHLSDSLALTMAMCHSALDLNQPKFAHNIVRHFMAMAADKREFLSDSETSQVEAMFLASLVASDPKAADALLGAMISSQTQKPSQADESTNK